MEVIGIRVLIIIRERRGQAQIYYQMTLNNHLAPWFKNLKVSASKLHTYVEIIQNARSQQFKVYKQEFNHLKVQKKVLKASKRMEYMKLDHTYLRCLVDQLEEEKETRRLEGSEPTRGFQLELAWIPLSQK